MVRIGAFFTVLVLVSSSIASANYSIKTYTDVKAHLEALAKKYPATTTLLKLGISDSGQMIEAIKVGNGPMHTLVVSTHHGNEYGATEVGNAFAESVAREPIVGQTVFVIPVLNIGGYNVKDRREPALGTTWDPNRDYPGPCGTEGPFKLKSTAMLAKFIADNHIVASATLHTFSPAVVYPWGISTQDTGTPYDTIFKNLADAATVESKYATGNDTLLIYPADGAFEDYAYWKHGTWSLLFELGSTHTPSDAEVEQLIAVNVPGLRRFLQQSPTQPAEKHDFTGKCDTSLAGLGFLRQE